MSSAVAILAVVALGAVAWAVTQALIVDEVRGLIPYISRLIVQRAVLELPEEFQERYAEEWLAELTAFRDRRLSGLVYAIGVRTAARSTGSELEAALDAEPERDSIRGENSASDPVAVAEFIAGLVERSASYQSGWEDAFETLRAALRDATEVDDELNRIHQEWVTRVQEWRELGSSDRQTDDERRLRELLREGAILQIRRLRGRK
jgi:hypothetical protein